MEQLATWFKVTQPPKGGAGLEPPLEPMLLATEPPPALSGRRARTSTLGSFCPLYRNLWGPRILGSDPLF